MRVLDRRGFWVSLCVIALALVLAGIRYMQKGFGEDFGFAFSIGMLLGIFLTMLAVGWRRGELRREPDPR